MPDDDQLDLLSHHPKSIDGDALGFRDYARIIREILTGLTAECTGLTIGIFGDWGSGKSTVLKMVNESLVPPERTLSLRLRRWFRRRYRRLWYRTLGRWSKKGRRLRAFRSGRSTVLRTAQELLISWERTLSVGLGRWFRRRFQQFRRRCRRLRFWILGRWSEKGQRLRTFRGQSQAVEYLEPKRYRPLVVEFDAWEYSKEQVWAALLREIVRTADEDLSLWQRVVVGLNLWWCRIQWNKVVYHLAWFEVRVFFALLLLWAGLGLVQEVLTKAQPSEWLYRPSVWLQAALGLPSTVAAVWILLTVILKGVWQGVQWVFNVRPSLPHNLLRPTLDKDTFYAVEQFRYELLDLIRVIGRRRPIVVLIDDLDRVPIDQVAPVLEAIQHFGVEPGNETRKRLRRWRAAIAFVLAADRQVIQHAVASYYKDFCATLKEAEADSFAREYLEKIVQIPLELPPLTSSELRHLLAEGPPASPDGGDEVLTLAAARRRAQSVFARGPKENPRQVIQAYNTFQILWRVVQQRRLHRVEPELFAVLILIRYVWPKVFDLFFRYPECFFDLRALATKRENRVCSSTEIEEILSLGCPDVEPTPIVDMVQDESPNVLFLLGGLLSLPQHLTGAGRLLEYLTLIRVQEAPTGFHLIESGAALLSGDPSLIKFVARTNRSRVLQERLPWLMEFIEPESFLQQSGTPVDGQQEDEREKAASGNQRQQAQTRMISALFALGRIRDGRAVEPIKQVIDVRSRLPQAVVERAIFALAHLAKDTADRRIAREALTEVLKDKETSPAVRLRIVRLFGSIFMPRTEASGARTITDEAEPSSRRSIVHLALRDDVRFVREQAIEIVQGMGWLEEALEELEDDPDAEGALDNYLRIVEKAVATTSAPALAEERTRVTDPVPEPVMEHLVALAAGNASPYQARAFEVLAGFPEIKQTIERIATVCVRTQDKEVRKQAITRMCERQAAPEAGVPWQDGAWTRVEEALADEAPEVWVVFAQALGRTHQREAVDHLRRVGKHTDARVRDAAREALYGIAYDEAHPEAATAAQAVLEEWAGSVEA